MSEIPEHLLRRSAEAKAKALGLPVEQVLAEMKGETPPEAEPGATPEVVESQADADQQPLARETEPAREEETSEGSAGADEPAASAAAVNGDADEPSEAIVEDLPAADSPASVDDVPSAPPSGGGGPAVATAVVPRPTAPAVDAPEGVRTQRLLTVVKAKAIQQVKADPTDKVNTWPHLMLAEFTALLLMTAVLVVMSVVLHAPLLELANSNATPNPSKAPWYFLGLQELLSYYDPQIAGVVIPGIVGLLGMMAVPYIDRNPSTKPSDRKFAIMFYTFFVMGSAVLTVIGTLFRGPGFNWTYPWSDGIWFDDLKDWVSLE